MQIEGISILDWANAISRRLADEWHSECDENIEILQIALERALINTPASIKELIGTEVIEEDYFDKID